MSREMFLRAQHAARQRDSHSMFINYRSLWCSGGASQCSAVQPSPFRNLVWDEAPKTIRTAWHGMATHRTMRCDVISMMAPGPGLENVHEVQRLAGRGVCVLFLASRRIVRGVRTIGSQTPNSFNSLNSLNELW